MTGARQVAVGIPASPRQDAHGPALLRSGGMGGPDPSRGRPARTPADALGSRLICGGDRRGAD